jgi:hypothetical protein
VTTAKDTSWCLHAPQTAPPSGISRKPQISEHGQGHEGAETAPQLKLLQHGVADGRLAVNNSHIYYSNSIEPGPHVAMLLLGCSGQLPLA